MKVARRIWLMQNIWIALTWWNSLENLCIKKRNYIPTMVLYIHVQIVIRACFIMNHKVVSSKRNIMLVRFRLISSSYSFYQNHTTAQKHRRLPVIILWESQFLPANLLLARRLYRIPIVNQAGGQS